MNPSTQRQWKIGKAEFIALMAGLWALNSLAIDIMLPALPYMGEALHVAQENDRQLVISSYFLGFGIAQLFFGPLCDRFGRRLPLIIGLIFYILPVIAAIFAPNFETLLLLRAIQGIGAAATRISSQSAIRDRYAGRDMAEILSLAMMVFMIMPIVAPLTGQVLLMTGPWQTIFIFMGVVAAMIGVWAFLRLEESLAPENRRPLRFAVILDGFKIVFSNRQSLFYALAGTCTMSALFGFINSSEQVYVEVYGLGAYFPVAFAAVAGLMALSSFMNSQIVRRVGMRRLSHGALFAFLFFTGLMTLFSVTGHLPFWLFFTLLASTMFSFGWCGSNMNSLAMEPLGSVAGTASSVFGFMQTVGAALIGAFVGRNFDGTTTPVATGFFVLGLLSIVCVLIAEKGKLFGVGQQYAAKTPSAH